MNAKFGDSSDGIDRRTPWRPIGGWSSDFPTRGHHTNVWGYLLELIQTRLGVEIDDGRLLDSDVCEFTWQMRFPASIIHGAFDYLVRWGLVRVEDVDGRNTAYADTDRLVDRLRSEHILKEGASPGTHGDLSYFRTRKILAQTPWLEEVMDRVDAAGPDATRVRGEAHGDA